MVTKSFPNDPAISRLTPTPEIVGMLLSFLDLKDLLRLQMVCSYWRDFVTDSSILQQQLFLQPSTNPRQAPQLNPLLAELFPPLFRLDRPFHYSTLYRLYPITKMNHFVDQTCRERILRPEASWRRMFPVQPPAKLDLFNVHSRDECLYDEGQLQKFTLGKAHQPLQANGLQMGLLFDLIAFLDETYPAAGFYVHYRMFPVTPSRDTRWHDGVKDDGEDYYCSGYAPLNPRREYKAQNSIELYYNHDWWCYGGANKHDLRIESDFRLEIESNPRSLFDAEELVDSELWDEHLPEETVTRLRKTVSLDVDTKASLSKKNASVADENDSHSEQDDSSDDDSDGGFSEALYSDEE